MDMDQFFEWIGKGEEISAVHRHPATKCLKGTQGCLDQTQAQEIFRQRSTQVRDERHGEIAGIGIPLSRGRPE